MGRTHSPIEIARQAFMQLSKEKKLPTPENYRLVYNEIAGCKDTDKLQTLGKALQKVLRDASKRDNRYASAERQIAELLERTELAKLEGELVNLLTFEKKNNETNWSTVIKNLLKQLETSHKGMTLSRKKEGLSRVLTNFAGEPEVLGEKIQALADSWGKEAVSIEVQTTEDKPETEETALETIAVETIADTSKNTATENTQSADAWRKMILETMELALIPALKNVPEEQEQARILLASMRQPSDLAALSKHADDLKNTLIRLEMQRDTQQQVHASLLNLLRLMSQSMNEMVLEDDWLTSQISIVNNIINKPINTNSLYDAETTLKNLIEKQVTLKPALHNAKDTLKSMVSKLIGSLAGMAESTSDYHSKIEAYQDTLSQSEELDDLNRVLKSILEDTRLVGISVEHSRAALEENQKKATEAEQKIKALTAELDHISEVAHEDFLTGTLNRRGMDEALEREFTRADRYNTELCIAMMDIDHFKKINDSMGHSKGDEALTHFANIVKKVKRTTDVLARYGGEEFIIILPATKQDDAIKVVQRVQRELTKNFFLNNDERVLITFSAGVAEREENESVASIIPRADAALYEAKHTGRNRVVGAAPINKVA